MPDTNAIPPLPPAAPPPGVVYLSPDEQQAILASLNRQGWTIVAGAASPDLQQSTDQLGRQVQTSKGTYTINVQDPQGRTQAVSLARGNPLEDGTPTWVPRDVPDLYPKDTSKQVPIEVTDAQGNKITTIYDVGPDNVYRPNTTAPVAVSQARASNPDEDRIKAIEAQVATSQRDEKLRNLATAGQYLTDQQIVANAQADRAAGQVDTRLNDARQQAQAADKRADDKMADELATLRANVAKTGAETGLIGAQTARTSAETGQVGANVAQTTQATEAASLQAPLTRALTQQQIDELAARKASQQQQTTIAGQPAIADVGTGPFISTRDPLTGAISQQVNLSAAPPKTAADVAGRVGQLQSAAQAKRDELSARIGTRDSTGRVYSADDASRDFLGWWGTNVEPQKGMLIAAQATAGNAEERANQEQQRANLTTAQAAGQNVAAAYQATLPYRTGPNFEKLMGQIAGGFGSPTAVKPDFTGALSFQGRDPAALYQQATAQALAHISPHAASLVGTPGPNGGPPAPSLLQPLQGMDIGQALNATNYKPGTTTVHPDGTVVIAQPTQPTQAAPAATLAPPQAAPPPQGPVPQYAPPPNQTADDIIAQLAANGGAFSQPYQPSF